MMADNVMRVVQCCNAMAALCNVPCNGIYLFIYLFMFMSEFISMPSPPDNKVVDDQRQD